MSQPQRIYFRFFGVVLPVILVVFASTIALFEWFEHSRQIDSLREKLNRVTSTFSLLYAEPLAIQDAHQIKSYSLALIVDEDVAALTLTDMQGAVIESLTTGLKPDAELTSTVSINYADEAGLERLGWLTVVMSRARVDGMLIEQFSYAGLLLLMLVVASVCSMIAALFPSVHVSLKRLGEEASYDALTGLLNRRSFALQVERLLSNTRRSLYGQLLFLDLDGFKRVNDGYGHRQGDLLLQSIAQVLKHNIRTDDAVARLGGDEFAILLKDCDEDNCSDVAESIRAGIQSLNYSATESTSVSVSIGIVAIASTRSFEEHLEIADQACYRAKRTGKNRICFASELPRLCA